MKIKQIVVLMLLALALAWMPANSEAALSNLSFSGSADWLLTNTNYVNTYDGRTFVTGKSMSGFLQYESVTSEIKALWMDVQDNNNIVYRFESKNGTSGHYIDTSSVPGSYVFEIQGNAGTLTNLVLSNLSAGSSGTWYFDYDNNPSFRIGGNAQVVPIPAAVWLLGSGLVGLVGLRRRMSK